MKPINLYLKNTIDYLLSFFFEYVYLISYLNIKLNKIKTNWKTFIFKMKQMFQIMNETILLPAPHSNFVKQSFCFGNIYNFYDTTLLTKFPSYPENP